MRDAFRLDPLSPIINANVGFDALRFGDEAEAEARFAAAIEIDPAFQVPYSGMARLHAARGSLEEALRWIEQAIERAPGRAFYLARKGLILAQLGRTDEAVATVEAACCNPTGNRFEADLVVGLRVVSGNRAALAVDCRQRRRVHLGCRPARAGAHRDRRPAGGAPGVRGRIRPILEARSTTSSTTNGSGACRTW